MAKTEITVQIFEDIQDVKKKLSSLGYDEFEIFTGEDSYFTTLRQDEIKVADYKKLLSSSLIIRSFQTKGHEEKNNYLVFKNKTLNDNGDVVAEEKVSTQIKDVESCKKALTLAGLNNWVNLKQQNSFFKKGEFVITVGTVEELDGSFMEIEEYPLIANLSENQKIEALKNLANTFEFKTGDDYSVKKVYMLFKKINNK